MERPDRINYLDLTYAWHGDITLDKDKYIKALEAYCDELERQMHVVQDAFDNAETRCTKRECFSCLGGACSECDDLGVLCNDIRYILKKGKVDLFI